MLFARPFISVELADFDIRMRLRLLSAEDGIATTSRHMLKRNSTMFNRFSSNINMLIVDGQEYFTILPNSMDMNIALTDSRTHLRLVTLFLIYFRRLNSLFP